MKYKKRRKSSRFRGSQTAHRGAKERTRGSGNQGGKGMSGTGKRGDQKKSLVINLTGGNNYFGKSRTLRRGVVAPKLKVINLSDIQLHASSLSQEKGIVDLKGYKILGDGTLTQKLSLRASAASTSAKEKIEEAGGTLLLEGEESAPEEKPEKKAEKKEEPQKKATPKKAKR